MWGVLKRFIDSFWLNLNDYKIDLSEAIKSTVICVLLSVALLRFFMVTGGFGKTEIASFIDPDVIGCQEFSFTRDFPEKFKVFDWIILVGNLYCLFGALLHSLITVKLITGDKIVLVNFSSGIFKFMKPTIRKILILDSVVRKDH